MVTALAQTCIHHPARPGAALCMRCHQVVCQECATRWDGINYCRPCLALRRGATQRRAPVWDILSRLGLVVLWLALLGAVARLMAWSLAQVGSWLS